MNNLYKLSNCKCQYKNVQKEKQEFFNMLENSYLFYSEYLKNRFLTDKMIMIARTKKSYLVGSLIDIYFMKILFIKV